MCQISPLRSGRHVECRTKSLHRSTQALSERMADCDASYAVVVWEQEAWPIALLRGRVTGSACLNPSRPECTTRPLVLIKLYMVIWLAIRKGFIHRIKGSMMC